MNMKRLERVAFQRVARVATLAFAGLALMVAPGCALFEAFDPPDPIRPTTRNSALRPARAPGALASQNAGATRDPSSLGSDDDVFGPKPHVTRRWSGQTAAPAPTFARNDPAALSADPEAKSGGAASAPSARPLKSEPQDTAIRIEVPHSVQQSTPPTKPEPVKTDAGTAQPGKSPLPDSNGASASLVDRPPEVRTIPPVPVPAPLPKPPEPVAPVPPTPSGEASGHAAAPATQPSVAVGTTQPAADESASVEKLSPARQEVHNRVAALKTRLKNGVDVDDRDDQGRTLLQQAAIAGDLEVAELLLDSGANIKAQDRQGWTALHWAASSGHPEICELLVASGAPINARGNLDDTPLQWAAAFDRRDVVELLVARGADVNAFDKRGRTALHVAVENDARATVGVLLEQHADVKVHDESGLTALHYVVIQARKALLDLETPEGSDAKPAAADRERKKILDHAEAIAKMLLEKGADVNAATARGVTSLHLAAWDDVKPIAQVLLSYGADAEAKDQRERTPAEYAKLRGQKAVGAALATNVRKQ